MRQQWGRIFHFVSHSNHLISYHKNRLLPSSCVAAESESILINSGRMIWGLVACVSEQCLGLASCWLHIRPAGSAAFASRSALILSEALQLRGWSDINSTCSSFRISVLDSGSLRISNATKSDAGLYTCVARNQFGEASSSRTLTVKGTDYFSTLIH